MKTGKQKGTFRKYVEQWRELNIRRAKCFNHFIGDAKNPTLVKKMEKSFKSFEGSLRQEDLAQIKIEFNDHLTKFNQ